MSEWQSGLDSEDAASARSGIFPLDDLGIDPDEANLNRADVLARVAQSPLEQAAAAYKESGGDGGGATATPLRSPATAPAVARTPTATGSAPPRPAWHPPMAADDDVQPPAAAPKPATAAAVAPATGAESGDGGAPSSMESQLSQYGVSGLQGLKDSMDSATSAASQIPVTDGQSQSLEQQLTRDTAARPQAYDPTTGKMNAQYKPSVGQRILRGFEGAGLGLAEGGIHGLVAGAIKPELTGSSGYGAPTAQYGRDIEANARTVVSDTQQLTQAQAAFKAKQDALKARASDSRATAALGKDLTTGATGLINANTDSKVKPIEAGAKAAEAARPPVSSPQAKAYDYLLSTGMKPDKAYEKVREKPGAVAGSGTGLSTSGSGVTGTDYLNTLPVGVRGQVQAIGEGRMAPPSSRSKQGMAILNSVTQAYPGFDASQFPTYSKTRMAFTSGKEGQGINSFKTALNHLDLLEQHLPDNTSMPAANWVMNLARKASGSAALKPFEADALAVSNEVERAYKGGALSEGDYNHMRALLNENDSPASMRASIGELRDLLHGKLDAYQQQWESAMPKGVVSPLGTLNASANSFSWDAHPVAK